MLDESVPTPKLSNKHRRFVDEYFINNMNATAAYCATYGVDRDTGRNNGARLLANDYIQAEITRRMKEKAMGSDEVLTRLSGMARASHLPFIQVNDKGAVFFDFSHPDAKENFYLIKKIKTKRTRRIEGRGDDAEIWEDELVEVELHDSQAALEKIGKQLGMFRDKVDLRLTMDGLTDDEIMAELRQIADGLPERPGDPLTG